MTTVGKGICYKTIERHESGEPDSCPTCATQRGINIYYCILTFYPKTSRPAKLRFLRHPMGSVGVIPAVIALHIPARSKPH
jgi:hypothetical protein